MMEVLLTVKRDDSDTSLEAEMQEDDGSDVEYEDLIPVSVDKNVPILQVDAFTVDDDGNVVRNVFSKMYQTGGCGQEIRMAKSPYLLGTCSWTRRNRAK